MKVSELAQALRQLAASGHGGLDVFHVMGNGREKLVCGWELVGASGFDTFRDQRESGVVGERLRLFTSAPF